MLYTYSFANAKRDLADIFSSVIKDEPRSYCDCKFSYDLKDLKTDYYCQAKVLCPCCGTDLLHSKREREN